MTVSNDMVAYRPVFFNTTALLYTPKQPARAQKCSRIKKDTLVELLIDIAGLTKYPWKCDGILNDSFHPEVDCGQKPLSF